RRAKARTLTFSDHLDALRKAGFTVNGSRVVKHGCVAVLDDRGDGPPVVKDAGVLMGDEIGLLENGGYQQFFTTNSGRRLPALAEQLRALHNFREDLKEALGNTSFYNEGLGTVSDRHMYDRVKGRDPH
ncbi:MAG TPA: hypothetical protein VES20_05235, partial [Bryobacteraceae bacterium]|nr:hypothetical protein [Bryobacteraceae bacterium]